jgi:hypothetical protein
MSYYYITNTYDVYKTAGGRKVKKIHSQSLIKKIIEMSNGITNASQGVSNLVMPMMRCMFPRIITQELITVQPMSGPVGSAFALKCRYDQPKNHQIKKDRLSKYIDKNTIPLYVFIKKHTVIFETPNFYDVLFELSTKNLNQEKR